MYGKLYLHMHSSGGNYGNLRLIIEVEIQGSMTRRMSNEAKTSYIFPKCITLHGEISIACTLDVKKTL